MLEVYDTCAISAREFSILYSLMNVKDIDLKRKVLQLALDRRFKLQVLKVIGSGSHIVQDLFYPFLGGSSIDINEKLLRFSFFMENSEAMGALLESFPHQVKPIVFNKMVSGLGDSVAIEQVFLLVEILSLICP